MNWETQILYFALPAGFIGAVGGFAMGLDTDLRARSWGALYFTRTWKTSAAKILRRAHFVADQPILTQIRVFLPAFVLLIPITVLSLYSDIFSIVQLFYFSGFIMARLIMTANDLGSMFVFPEKLLPIAAKMVGRYCDPSDALPFLNELALRLDEHAQISAINGYAELPAEFALPALNAFETTLPFPKKQLVKQLARISALRNGIHPEDLTRLRKLNAEIKAISNAGRGKPSQSQMLQFEIDEIIYTHRNHLASFPNLYCLDCFRFPEKVEQHQKFWIQCPNCLEAHQLKLDIHQVVGHIGEIEASRQHLRKLFIPLWDEDRKKASTADIHTLEIIGGQAINYDWAVNSLMEAFYHRPPSKMNIQVVLTNSPQLEPNTMRLLEELNLGI